MEPNISALSKKTKADILNEYEKLLRDFEDAKQGARMAHEPTNIQQVSTVKKDFTVRAVEEGIDGLKSTVGTNLGELSKRFGDVLDALLRQTSSEAEKFTELQKAVEISKKQLETQYHIEVAARTLEDLVAQHEEKKLRLEQEYARKTIELEDGAETKRRDRKREEEQYEYDTKLRRSREQAQFDEKRRVMEAELKRREDAVKMGEEEMKRLRDDAAKAPSLFEKELAAREIEVSKHLEAEHKREIEILHKDWESEKRLTEARMKTLEDQNKRLESEVLALKKEVEAANKKSQDLAVRVIESGTGSRGERNDRSTPPAPAQGKLA